MKVDLNIVLLAEKSVGGSLDQKERMELEDWLASDPLNRKEFEELCEILQVTDAGLASIDPRTEAQWAALESVVAAEPAVVRRGGNARRAWAIAATVCLLAVVGYFLVQGLPSQQNGMEQVVYTAGAVEARFVLPDQSEIWLQPGAQVTLASAFNQEERRLELQGAGRFKVSRDEARPFVVKAGKTETKVLGTEFVLKALAGNGDVDLVVLQGKVSFAGPNATESAILTANMQGHYDGNSGQIRLGNTASGTATHHDVPGKVVADGRALREVLPEIEALYQVKLDIPENLLDMPLNATFEAGEEGDMVAALELVLHGIFEKKDATYHFSPR